MGRVDAFFGENGDSWVGDGSAGWDDAGVGERCEAEESQVEGVDPQSDDGEGGLVELGEGAEEGGEEDEPGGGQEADGEGEVL